MSDDFLWFALAINGMFTVWSLNNIIEMVRNPKNNDDPFVESIVFMVNLVCVIMWVNLIALREHA